MGKFKIEPQSVTFKEVDYNKLKQAVEFMQSDDWKISTNSHISEEAIELLKDCNEQGVNLNNLFAKDKNVTTYSYIVPVVCHRCNKHFNKMLSKTSLFSYISSTDDILCDECDYQNKVEAELKRAEYAEKQKEEWNKQIVENTKNYIENYLSPEAHWVDTSKSAMKEHYLEIANTYCIDCDEIESAIKGMSYYDFLNTPYWKAVSAEAKRKAGYRCQLCDSSFKLITHHKTYENHGKEHTYQVMKNDLIVLCDDCHKKFHEIGEDDGI